MIKKNWIICCNISRPTITTLNVHLLGQWLRWSKVTRVKIRSKVTRTWSEWQRYVNANITRDFAATTMTFLGLLVLMMTMMTGWWRRKWRHNDILTGPADAADDVTLPPTQDCTTVRSRPYCWLYNLILILLTSLRRYCKKNFALRYCYEEREWKAPGFVYCKVGEVGQRLALKRCHKVDGKRV